MMETNQNHLDKFNFELDQKMKGMMGQGIYPGRFIWVLGKIAILKELGKKYGVKVEIGKDENEQVNRWIKLASWLIKYRLNGLIFTFVKLFIKLKALSRPIWYYDMDGHKLLINERDVGSREILKDYTLLKVWEPETTKLIKENVKQGDTCLDVGASIGYFTLLFARQVGETGKVIAVEPTERCFKYLKKNVEKNGYKNVSLSKIAAWDKNEQVRVPVNDPNPMIVEGKTMDSLIGNEKIDFIKIDVDGPEPRVLKGLIKTFENNPQLKMVIEFYPRYIEMAGCSSKEFEDITNKYFDCVKIPGDYGEEYWNLYCQCKRE